MEDLNNTNWLGEVVDNIDPKKLGRCKIKVFGKFDQLPNDAIPWATSMTRNQVGAHAIPNIGSIVAVRFDNNNLYHPEYWFQINQDQALKEDILDNSDAAENVTSLVYDEIRNLRIYHSPEDGLVIAKGEGAKERPLIQIDEQNFIKITTDEKIFLDAGNVFLSNTGEDSEDENEPAVRGISLQKWLEDLLQDYQNHFHPTGVGPSGPPAAPTPTIIQQLNQAHINYQQKDK